MTASSQDDKLIQLKDEFGMEGYGVYWAIIEMIAAQINQQNQQTFVEFSVKSWRKITEFSPKKLENFAVFSNKIELFDVAFNGNKIRFCAPNILKYKDEYSRKSGQTPDIKPLKVRTKSGATPEEDIETKKDTDKEREKQKPNGKFHPPSVEDVSLYCKQRGNGINPDSFVDFYTSKNWFVGKNKMKDWKACVRTWEQRDRGNGKDSQKVNRIKKDQFV